MWNIHQGKRHFLEAGEMAQRLMAFAAHAEDQGLLPSTCKMALNCLQLHLQFPRVNHFLQFYYFLFMCMCVCLLVYMYTTCMQIPLEAREYVRPLESGDFECPVGAGN